VKPEALLELLREFYGDKLTAMLRHQTGATVVSQYDVNNTYQYVLAREETQLDWVRRAIVDLGGQVGNGGGPGRAIVGKGIAAAHTVLEEDARDAQAFYDRWHPRVETVTNARHRLMLRVILGEVIEQKRFFTQALAGRTDLLGRRTTGSPPEGAVLATRWIE